MATTEELQQQLAALTARVDGITAPPTDYYTSRYSGEEADNGIARALPGGEIDTALSNKAEWNDGFLQSGSILEWGESKNINTGIAINGAVMGAPYPGHYGVNLYIYPAGGWRLLTAIDITTGDQYCIVKNASIPWPEKWTRLATATPPVEYDLSLANGFTSPLQYINYSKTQEGIVTINGTVGGTFPNGIDTTFANLPEGYRPGHPIRVPASSIAGAAGDVTVLPDGRVQAFFQSGATWVFVNASFIA